MSRKTTRRDFVKQSTALGAAWWVGSQSAYALQKSPVERLNFACIGVDGKGSSDTNSAGGNGNVVALCDIDDNRLNKKAAAYPKARKFNDYRKMLEEMADKIDAVTVSTPDHSHAPASVMAMKLGKHCFTQKPLTWSVFEARTMRETAAKYKVATQMGNQGTSENGLRDAVEVVRSGGIGDVSEVHVWTNRPVWPQGTGRPKTSPPIPKNIHWDLFLGPAAYRPYHPAYQPFKWRGWLDFGTGALGDMACHTANMAVMALDLFDPLTLEAESTGIVENETYPTRSKIIYEFGERKAADGRVLPPCKMFWYDGGYKPPEAVTLGQKIPNSGLLLVGSKGTLYSPSDYGKDFKLLPEENFADYKKPEQTLPRSPGHFKEFAIACAGGPAAMSNFEYAARLTETVVLGNFALRAGNGVKLEWDAKKMKVTNKPEMNQFIHREYREGWTL